MLFEAPKTPNFPLEKVFEEAAKTFMLPSVLPHEVGALQTLLVAQQEVMQTLRQEAQTAHQEALAILAQAQTIRDEAHAYVIRMLEQATLARQRMFGASSEQMSAQSRLFDEAEVLAQNSTDAQDTAPIADEAPQGAPTTAAPATKPARGKRAPLAAGLPRVDVLHDVPEADRTYPCGTPMVLIGQDISEQLDIVPMQVSSGVSVAMFFTSCFGNST